MNDPTTSLGRGLSIGLIGIVFVAALAQERSMTSLPNYRSFGGPKLAGDGCELRCFLISAGGLLDLLRSRPLGEAHSRCSPREFPDVFDGERAGQHFEVAVRFRRSLPANGRVLGCHRPTPRSADL